jgi:phosphoribosyl 1,2-cyclic phosphodiesterase
METYNVENSIAKVISSGSNGNAVLYHETILIDIGVPYKQIEPYKRQLQIVLLTHEHLSDHLNISALKKLCFERPTLRVACGQWMVKYLEGIKNIDVLEAGKVYDYGSFKISPIKLYHDVPNFGYRIFKEEHKTIHVTDTSHLIGISAKEYDLYAIEYNYDDETIHDSIAKIESRGGYAYQKGAINSHLSQQQAKEFIFNNKGICSKILRLHESKNQ